MTGVYMRNWDRIDEFGNSTCTADQDARDAGRAHMRIPARKGFLSSILLSI